MIHELEVLQSDCQRIGDPIALSLTDLETTNNDIQQDAKALPTLDDRKKPTNDNKNNLNSKGTNLINKERVISINILNPYMNKFELF